MASSGFALVRFLHRFRADERNNQLVEEVPLRTRDAQLVRPRIHLFDCGFLSAFCNLKERVHAQRIVEIKRQILIALPQEDPARNVPAFTQLLYCFKGAVALFCSEFLQLVLSQ